MSNTTTIARPYASAIFEHALATDKLAQWSAILNELAIIVLNDKVIEFIANPATTESQQAELLLVPLIESSISTRVKNLINLLVHNKRLMLLPDIKVLFEILRSEQEKTLEVKVISFSELSSDQRQNMVSSLTQRLKRRVTLNESIDKSLLGGAIIHAGDLVIDGSVRGKLNKLGTGLAA